MADSTLRFKVLADTGSAVSGFANLAKSMLPIKKSAEATNTALDKIGKHKPKLDVNDQALDRAQVELKQLRDQLARDLSADINADTSEAQKKIRRLESTIKTLSRAKSKITPEVDTTKATGAIARLKGAFGKIGGAFKSGGALSQEGPIGGFFNFLSNVAGGLGPIVSGVATGLVGIGKAAVTGATGMLMLADSADQSRNTFKLFLGSFGAADKQLNALTKLAAATPFELPELKSASLRLLGVGMNAKQANKALTVLGNTAAAFGTDVEGVATIWSQMVAAGKINAEDMNQLVDRGIPAWKLLGDSTGKSVAELKELSSKGKLGKDALEDLYQQMGKDYAGQMDVQSGTLSGMISTLKDTWDGIQRDIGNAFLPLAKSLIPGLTKGLEGVGDKIVGNLPKIIDTVAAGMQTMITMPGTILRGLASVAQGFAGMISGIQTSMATLVSGIADSLESLPAIFGDIDTSGLRDAALGMAQASIETNKVGKAAFDGLTSAAAAADKAVAPLAAKIEAARKAGQTAVVIQLETKAVDTKITAAEAKIKKLTTQKNNVKLDADKKYFQDKIDAAEKELARLKRTKANIPIDAKIDKLTTKLSTARSKLTELSKKKSTPTVNADIGKFTKQRNKAIKDLATLSVKRANPKLDANSKEFKAKVAAAEKKLSKVDKDKASPDITADDKTGPGVRSAKSNLNSVKDKTVTITTRHKSVKVNSGGPSRGTGGGNDPNATMAPTVVTVTPQISLHLRDERLADLIDIRVDGRAARAAHVVGRRRGVLL